MKILGIESSCDETAAAVVEDGTKVLSNVIASQVALHHETGGVVPEVAAREHVVKIIPVVQKAVEDAGLSLRAGDELLPGVDAIAVTEGPGLLSSLLIGATAAHSLSIASGKQLISVNHISGHIYANWLEEDPDDAIQFPVLVLTVSGGHNELVYMEKHATFKLLGETLDDAAGEAFDKVARILGLGYPGGPIISRKAEEGDVARFDFPQARLGKDSFDFSFSGLKTAVLNVVKEEFGSWGKLSEKFIADCSASFQEAVCQVLVEKLMRAIEKFEVKEVHLAGGVSANLRLRELVEERVGGRARVRYAKKLVYCTDNAAMIAAAGYFCKGGPQNVAGAERRLADPNLRMYD